MATDTVSLKHVGSVELNELIGMCAGHGDGIPYPLWRTTREPYWGDIEKSLPRLADRLNDDLGTLREWVHTYAAADIWVEYRVQSFTPGIAGIRLVAHRAGETGFVGVQRPEADVVDVYRLSALQLGAAVAGLSELAQPGTRQTIRVPGFLDNFIDKAAQQKPTHDLDEDEDFTASIRESPVLRGNTTTISDYDNITLMATVQSRCHPSADRGLDWIRDVVIWVRIDGDGDYVYTPDRVRAVPVSTQTLRTRIDELIAADVAALRQLRGLT